MKKLMLLGCALLVLTGCGQKVKCTAKVQGTEIEIVGKVKDGKIVETATTAKYDDKDEAKSSCSSAKKVYKNEDDASIKCSSKKVTVTEKDVKEDKDEFVKNFKAIYGGTCEE